MSRYPQYAKIFVVGSAFFWFACARHYAQAADTGSQNFSDKLVVHEWGTFTSLEDETGRSLGGINVDDEPAPPFVHQVMQSYALVPQYQDFSRQLMQGAPAQYPYVTIRLETPVMYFYPPKSQTGPLDVDVKVEFQGGWLTQFYPAAQTDTPQPKMLVDLEKTVLTHDTRSCLEWNHLQVGTTGIGPETDEAVWLTPRNVPAANVTTSDGESERYLFYRGVGHIESQLAVSSDAQRGTLKLQPRFGELLEANTPPVIRYLWLVKINDSGAAAFRKLDPIKVTGIGNKPEVTVPGDFSPADFAPENLARLQQEMHMALVAEGLFDEEATAMLKTWEYSYFRSGGWRLFFIVPKGWTQHYLPLTLSQPAEITRVMMGRIELISPEQRKLLGQLGTSQISDASWVRSIPPSPAATKFFSGHSNFGDLGVPIPADYQLYLALGRFRNALLVDEEARRPCPALEKFIANYDLAPFKVSAAKDN
ncbi:MAG TPA: hypothetical protein VMJ32_09675 [Pirellulales bacterium]|nr:hypothetical protein [Pirellulales bacterium]